VCIFQILTYVCKICNFNLSTLFICCGYFLCRLLSHESVECLSISYINTNPSREMFVVSHPSSTTHTHILNVNSSVGSFRVKALPKETKNDEITSSNKHRTTKLAISN